MEHIFFEISAVLIGATFFATVAKVLKQPMIPAYILSGVILGPSVLNFVKNGEFLEALSTFGIAFLLFLVGIELDLRKFLKAGKIAIILGFSQMAIAIAIGYVIVRYIGFDSTAAFLLAVAFGFSSTIVGLKLLSEKRETDSLYGQIVIGMMLTQDFIAVLFLIFFDVFVGEGGSNSLVYDLGWTFVKGFSLVALAFFSSKYILSHVFRYFARSHELLFLGAICWCLVFASIAELMHFSIEVGALIAGVSLSFLPYSIEIATRIKTLRDFFLPMFFGFLGGQLVFVGMADVIGATIAASLLVLFVSPLVVTGLLLFFGYEARTSLKAGLVIGQISEFSFIIVSLGNDAGILDREAVSLIALIGLVTMTLSTYAVTYFDPIYKYMTPFLKRFERKKMAIELSSVPDDLANHVVLFGHTTMGEKIRRLIMSLKKPLLVVDYNPDVMKKLSEAHVRHLYGNINDEEILEAAKLGKAEYIISTVHDVQATIQMLDFVQKHNMKAKTIVAAYHIEDALELYEHGANLVLYTTSITVDYLHELLEEDFDIAHMKREEHIKELKSLQVMSLTTS